MTIEAQCRIKLQAMGLPYGRSSCGICGPIIRPNWSCAEGRGIPIVGTTTDAGPTTVIAAPIFQSIGGGWGSPGVEGAPSRTEVARPVFHHELAMILAAAARPHGCVCPVGAEATCMGLSCPRRLPGVPR